MADFPRPPSGEDVSTGSLEPLTVLPERYSLREKDGTRFIECDEAPRVRAVIDPAMSVSASEAAALGERTVLLDGAGSFGPLIDNERKLYNLDHHAGCERLFTLATCEQALLMVHGGLDLGEGDWTLYANDPDLDTVLALWCLLNHRRVRELSSEASDVLVPLIRLEGAIDANGLELAQLCGLSSDVLEATQKRIGDLLSRERALKQEESWTEKDPHAYTLELLQAVDALVFAGEDFGDYTRIEEVYGHITIADRGLAVVCRDPAGIFAVEQHLKDRWGDQLGILALENQPGHFTLRRLRSVSGPELTPAYDLLNRIDPAVDGRPPGKRWGGSADIGGSPRPSGTGLTPEALLSALGAAYQRKSLAARVGRMTAAASVALLGVFFVPLAIAAIVVLPALPFDQDLLPHHAVAVLAGLAGLMAAIGARSSSKRRPWVYGWRRSARGWVSPLAIVPLLGALPLLAWTAGGIPVDVAGLVSMLVAGALAVASTELWFRGLVHGMLVLDGPIQHPGSDQAVSRAAVVSSLGYTAAVLAAAAWATPVAALAKVGITPAQGLAGLAVAAFASGLALAAIRERSLSILPGLGLQLLGAFIAVVAAFVLP